MEYEPKQFFKEHEHDEVNGFTILQAKDGQYHIGEKWEVEDADTGQWMDYWIPATDLQARLDREECEPVASLTDEQFTKVCKNVDWRYDTGEAQVNADAPTDNRDRAKNRQ